MSVLRAILGRFARFLVRIARTLDPQAAPAVPWAIPARMAALRQRYPEAPEHWLELIARRTAIADMGAPARRGEREVAAHAFPKRHLEQQLLPPLHKPAQRPAPRFPRLTLKPRKALAAEAERAASYRPLLSFWIRRARQRVPNSPSIEQRDRHAEPLDVGSGPAPPRDRDPSFADQSARAPERRDWRGAIAGEDATAQRELEWPRIPYRSPVEANWPRDGSRTTRPDVVFPAVDDRWPELLVLADEADFAAAAIRDERTFFSEQIEGAWSG